MVCFYFLILIPLITATKRFDGPSYRSNIMDGDKPILRMSPNADNSESKSDEGRQTLPALKTKDPELVRDLGLLVNWLMENFSYDLVPMVRKSNNVAKQSAKPILRMPVSDNADSDLDDGDDRDDDDNDDDDDDGKNVVSKIEIPEPLTENPVMPSQVESSVEPAVEPAVEPSVENESAEGALRTKHEKKKPEEEEPNPVWVKDLKDFIKDLTTRYGQHEVLERAKPVIASLEKKHKMKIKDIDVDEYGEIHITYIEKGKDKKVARKRKKVDNT